MAHGGKRPGTGAKKRSVYQPTLEKAVAREVLRELVTAKLAPMVEAQIDCAVGVSQFVYRDDAGRFKVIDDPNELAACLYLGKAVKVYPRPPSTPAFTDLFNRVLGKPTEQLEVTEAEGAPLTVRWLTTDRSISGRGRASEQFRTWANRTMEGT
ncbi:MAG: hypothetical protein ABJC51_02230 [Acidobacteriota bacterium]